MEEWQRKHITQNLPELILLTEFNIKVKAELIAQNILCKADVDKLNVMQIVHEHFDTCYHYYKLLMGRTDAYKVLTKVLMKCNQSGAARILIRVPQELFKKPLTYLGISTNLKGFKNVDAEVNGKTRKLHELCPVMDDEVLMQIIRDSFTEVEIYDIFVTKYKTLVLASNSVPPKPTFYIPRFPSNRIKIDEYIFKMECSDVFVFKNSIETFKLSQIAKPHFTDTSSSQLANITSRFIYLDETEDWIELRKLAKVSIHLINYEPDENIFILEDTTAPSDILKKLGSREKRVYTSEDEFVRMLLCNDSKISSVCICDTPGMGKSFLLANIARIMAEKCLGRIIVYIQLTTFVNGFCTIFSDNSLNHETVLINILKCVSLSRNIQEFLHKLVNAKFLRLEIFFDGFDEIPNEKVELWIHIFLSIITNFSTVRIYITSRSHMRQELEDSLGVVAYDILPFSQFNQVNFLVQFWLSTEPGFDQIELSRFAYNCLEAVKKSLTKNDVEIAGIPLLCQLIAETYADKVKIHSIKNRTFCEAPFKIARMYRNFIKMKINQVAQSKKEFDAFKLVHIWYALKLLFPTNRFHESNQFRKVSDLLSSTKIFNVGILQKHSNEAIEFIHRTFAEYLVAEYFALMLQDNINANLNGKDIFCNSIFMLDLPPKCQKTGWKYNFVCPTIVSFFNFALGEISICEEYRIHAVNYIASNLQKKLIFILCGCCQHGLFEIFSFLRDILIKCKNSFTLECFTVENSYELLSVCIEDSTSQLFRSCIQLLTEELKLEMGEIVTCAKEDTLLQLAVECLNYEAVEYLIDKVPLQGQHILKKCVHHSYYYSSNISRRENIVQPISMKTLY